MNQYIMLFRGGSSKYKQFTAKDLEKDQQNWDKWMEKLAEKGHAPNGLKLDFKKSSIVTKTGLQEVAYGQGDDIVNGYLILEAEDLVTAKALAKDCPLINLDGSVEIRQLVQNN